MTDDRIEELLTLAALGELDEREAAELDAALAADAEVAARLEADLDTAATVQATLAEDPPPALKAKILDAIDGVAQDHDTQREPATTTATGSVASLTASRPRRRPTQMLLAAAAVVAMIAGGLFVFSRTASAPTDVDVIATADDAIERELSEGDLLGLSVVFSPSRNAFVLVGTDIPAPNDAETYQVWLIDADGAQSVGTFRPDDDGAVAERFDDLDPTDFVVGVTVERASGSDVPTLPIRAATT